jgi:hypothetical protein
VELALLAGRHPEDIERNLSRRFGVSARTIREDARLVYEGWGRTDAEVMEARRAALVRRLDRIARKAEREGRYSEATEASRASAALHGLVAPSAVGLGGLAKA